MQVFQTWGVPPSLGKIILPTIGWTRKSKNALTNSVIAKKSSGKGPPPGVKRGFRDSMPWGDGSGRVGNHLAQRRRRDRERGRGGDPETAAPCPFCLRVSPSPCLPLFAGAGGRGSDRRTRPYSD